jgi:single-stranded-DNA-specific exonuclease
VHLLAPSGAIPLDASPLSWSHMRLFPVWQVAHEGAYDALLDVLLATRQLQLTDLQLGPEALHRPELLLDLERGAERIERAIRRGETIVVYGDYDVDGVTSTALIIDFLERAGANCHYLLPHRHTDGYGLKPPGVQRALALGASLIVTVDNGISAFEALELAKQEGVDVIVIDHHRQNADLPPAHSIINPNRRDCDYPFKGLAGVGVTFKVVQLLSEAFLAADERRRYLNDLLDLVVLGTVADVVPLLDENRILVKYGLRAAERTKRPGLRELRSVARCDRTALDTQAIAFYLGPRLNVAGRLEKPDLALELLRTTDAEDARKRATYLHELNQRRQKLEKEGMREAIGLVTDEDLERDRLLCTLGESWDLGVIGLLASKLAEAHWRPAIAVTDVRRDGLYVGSARSIPGYDINDGIVACREHLVTYGGHAAAAGFSLEADRYEAFRAELIDHANQHITPEQLQAHLEIDVELAQVDIDMSTVEQLRDLEPFGQGNRTPVFCSRGLEIVALTRVGKEGEHLKLSLKVNGRPRTAMWFRQGERGRELGIGQRVDVAFELAEDTFNGTGIVQMLLKDLDAGVVVNEPEPKEAGVVAA